MYTEITKCRISGSENLVEVLSLGTQSLTGVFPKSPTSTLTKGPLDLVWCPDSGLLQMKQSYSLDEMYGENYGYRSGLNTSMVKHLEQKTRSLEKMMCLDENELVVDIGSNDATLLKSYKGKFQKVGIDPTGSKFQEYYTSDIELISDFFSAAVFKKKFKSSRAKIITSVSMFYDLEDPIAFVKDIEEILEDDGIWHLEQSYMPSMLRTTSYDTICHEHLEFYSLKVVKSILERCRLRIIDVQMNAINGGSFAITACKRDAIHKPNLPIIDWILKQEERMNLDTLAPYKDFADRVFQHRESLVELIESLVKDGKKIIAYGASTKGNVLLQFCRFTTKHILCIAEVNKDKFGSYTPGSNIPIVSEKEAREQNPDYFLVLPWHFKAGILEREKEFRAQGGKFIFPLPEIEIV